jgi:guanine nucleotide-binding protein G(i) subunit alpha
MSSNNEGQLAFVDWSGCGDALGAATPREPKACVLAQQSLTRDITEEEQKKRSQAIDKVLDEDSKRLRRECKILLLGEPLFAVLAPTRKLTKVLSQLGSGESGKSTIVKQMKIIHLKGYSEDELYNYRATVFKNLVECAKAVISGMEQLSISPSSDANKKLCEYLFNYTVESGPSAHIEPEVGTAVQAIWSDPCIDKLMEHQTEFYLMDSAS